MSAPYRMLAVATLALLGACEAQVEQPEPRAAEFNESICKPISDLASTIMRARQSGALMSDMMARVSDDDPAIAKLTRALIIDAFDQPRFSTERMQETEITDFANDAYRACVKQS